MIHSSLRPGLCAAVATGILATSQPTAATLTTTQQNLIPIAAFTAEGNTTALRKALKKALDNGLSVSEARDALVQLYAYAGFPRSLTALSELVSLLNERQTAGIADKEGPKAAPRLSPSEVRKVGTAVQTRLIGRPAAGPVYDFAPDIDTYLKEHLFGDIFSTGILDDKTREIVTVSALAALPAPVQLRSHLNVCLNVGLTPDDLRAYAERMKSAVGTTEGRLAEESVKTVLQNHQH